MVALFGQLDAISGGRVVRNDRLREARERLPSRRHPGEATSRSELVTLVNEVLYPDLQQRRRSPFNSNYLGKLEDGVIHWRKPEYRAALRAVLDVGTDDELGFYVVRAGKPDSGAEALKVRLEGAQAAAEADT